MKKIQENNSIKISGGYSCESAVAGLAAGVALMAIFPASAIAFSVWEGGMAATVVTCAAQMFR